MSPAALGELDRVLEVLARLGLEPHGPDWRRVRAPRRDDGLLFRECRFAGTRLVVCESPPDQPVPDRTSRLALRGEREENGGPGDLWLVFTDAAHSEHLWTWTAEPRRGLVLQREHGLRAGAPPDVLTSRLAASLSAPPAAPRDDAVEQAIGRTVAAKLPRRWARCLAAADDGDAMRQLLSALQHAATPELPRAVWRALTGAVPGGSPRQPGLSAFDPACGDGAWLVRVLGALELVYDACLEQMRVLVDELARTRVPHRPERLRDLRRLLERVDRGPCDSGQRRFVRAEILRHNLFGSDCDPLAVAVCRARLLSLAHGAPQRTAAASEPRLRVGDPRQGCGTRAEVERAANAARMTEQAAAVHAEAALLARVERAVRGARFVYRDAAGLARAEAELARRRQRLSRLLHRMRAAQCGLDADDAQQLEAWLARRRPLHLYVEFHEVAAGRGFELVRDGGSR